MRNVLLIAVLVVACFSVKSQTRYFEFRQPFDSTLTSFIVASSDTAVINTVLSDIALPISQRRFISGDVTNGNGGFNHDGANWYTWHYIPNAWQLTSINVEFCDGISSLIGSNPAIIAGDTVYFCPWESYPHQEVFNPNVSIEDLKFNFELEIYPNPSADKVMFEWLGSEPISIDLYTVTGQKVLELKLSKRNNEINIRELSNGVYIAHITDGTQREIRKIIVEH